LTPLFLEVIVLKYSDYAHITKGSQFTYSIGEHIGLPILIDEGIILPDDSIITSGKLLDVIRGCKLFADIRDWEGLRLYWDNPCDLFTEEEKSILRMCVVTSRGDTILELLLD
jgi:hypothetical protein